LSFLVKEGKMSPQPTHADTRQAKTSAFSLGISDPPTASIPSAISFPSEKFGIAMLSKGANGTIFYNMEGLPSSPTATDVKHLWKDAPHALVDKLFEIKSARELLDGYGQLLFASHDRRVEPGEVPQFSISIFNGSHPHCAPAASGGVRSVLFFVLKPPHLDDAYNGKEQMSKEKLCLMLHDELEEALKTSFLRAERSFLLKKFAEAYSESSTYGAKDETVVYPSEDYDVALSKLSKAAQTQRERGDKQAAKREERRRFEDERSRVEDEIKAKEAELEELRAKSNTAREELHKATMDVEDAKKKLEEMQDYIVNMIITDDFRDGLVASRLNDS